jgi:hypothetical protein
MIQTSVMYISIDILDESIWGVLHIVLNYDTKSSSSITITHSTMVTTHTGGYVRYELSTNDLYAIIYIRKDKKT